MVFNPIHSQGILKFLMLLNKLKNYFKQDKMLYLKIICQAKVHTDNIMNKNRPKKEVVTAKGP